MFTASYCKTTQLTLEEVALLDHATFAKIAFCTAMQREELHKKSRCYEVLQLCSDAARSYEEFKCQTGR